MSQLQAKQLTDTWVKATWDEYLLATAEPQYERAKGYYHDGRMRLEMTPLGNPHSRDHATVIAALYLFAGLQGIGLDAHDNCTYRKSGFEDAQPDASFYLGSNADAIPWEATIIDLNVYPAPDLVIEVAYSSLADDKGEKRLLYESLGVESLGVREYWIIDVEATQIIAFAIQDRGSRRIDQSQVLSGLDLEILEEAFRRSRQMNHGKVSAWLLSQFSSQSNQ